MKKWIIAEKISEDIIEQLLVNRGIKIPEQDIFLNPNYGTDLHNPKLLDGAEKAAEKILEIISKNKKIGIIADYDADGVPGAALLYDVLLKLGAQDIFTLIPLRSDGYGFSKKGLDTMVKEKVDLIITIDLGITAKQEVEYAKEKNIDVIITDHHEIQKDSLPEAFAVINPKLSPKYPFKELCGTGVVFKLAQLLASKSGKISEDSLKWHLDLVGISTICDIVPLLDENRVLAKYGLIVLQKTRCLGLKKLYEASSIDQSKIDPYTVGFQIGPRLNAAGRIEDNSVAFELLTTKDEDRAIELASELNKLNEERQGLLAKSLDEAMVKIEKDGLSKNKIIMVSDENWQAGIVGLVASKITEKFCRPSIVLNSENGELKGSARSIEGLSLVEALSQVGDMLTRFGGHKKAAGLAMFEKNSKKFYIEILKIADEKLGEDDLLPKLHIDTILASPQINKELLDKIEKLEPFGLGNPRPVFTTKNAFISDLSFVGNNGKHLKLKLAFKEGSRLATFGGICFGAGETADVKKGDKIDIAFHLTEDTWNGNSKLQLQILDFKKAEVI